VVSYQPLRFGEVSLHLAFRGENSVRIKSAIN
jgi:hypothetical protein